MTTQTHLTLVNPALKTSQPSFWQKIRAFWTASGLERNRLSLDPEIIKGDRAWYAYESTTGQLTYLESEQDIDMWLDQTFRNQSTRE